MRSFKPQAGGDDCGVPAVKADGLRSLIFDLRFVNEFLLARGAQQIFAGEDLSPPDDEDHVVVQNLRHRRGVVSLNGGLVGGVERGDGAGVIISARGGRAGQGERRGGERRQDFSVH